MLTLLPLLCVGKLEMVLLYVTLPWGCRLASGFTCLTSRPALADLALFISRDQFAC